jgi:hypothetical protein
MTLKDRARAAGGSAATLADIIGDLPIDRVSQVAGLARGTLRYQLRAAREDGPRRSTLDAVRGAVEQIKKCRES